MSTHAGVQRARLPLGVRGRGSVGSAAMTLHAAREWCVDLGVGVEAGVGARVDLGVRTVALRIYAAIEVLPFDSY